MDDWSGASRSIGWAATTTLTAGPVAPVTAVFWRPLMIKFWAIKTATTPKKAATAKVAIVRIDIDKPASQSPGGLPAAPDCPNHLPSLTKSKAKKLIGERFLPRPQPRTLGRASCYRAGHAFDSRRNLFAQSQCDAGRPGSPIRYFRATQ